MADMIKVKSASDFTLVINAPELMLVKSWNKRGSFHLIQRDTLLQAFYNTSLETLVKKGMLVIEDKKFLVEVGLIEEENSESSIIELTPALMNRYISVIPVRELVNELKKMSRYQISELAEYAIQNYTNLKMDRIELLNKASGKDILKAIELHKASQED